MKAAILCIGDELLIGQVVNTNSSWLGQQLGLNGIAVVHSACVQDSEEAIKSGLDDAKNKADIILITGGLGPTKDDITKKTICEYFGMGWRTDEVVLLAVKEFFARYGKELNEINSLQAKVPDGCIAFVNKNGTAPGMWFEVGGKIFVSMPGVPFEMKAIMENDVMPMLKKKFQLPFIYHKTILTLGIGESVLAEKIEAWENSLAEHKIKLAYLPAPGVVRLRMSITGKNEEDCIPIVEKKAKELLPIVGGYIFGYGEDTIEKVIGDLLHQRQETLAVAESCTGGMISQMIVSVPGSSEYYKGGIISYANEVKAEQLDVPVKVINERGVVSEEVVRLMSENVRKKFNCTYGMGISGIAGPGGGTPDKPVGTVWMSISGPKGTFSRKMQFGDNRERNILRSSVMALGMLRKFILDELKEV
ncbi:MAG TPA: competence/damage-inducible protein A [Bacteroidia bacterium]|jgi:nicotinamide-nucleotide amidase|nr:competence/damage-inducible protein A [Bacteroidia bacterium]